MLSPLPNALARAAPDFHAPILVPRAIELALEAALAGSDETVAMRAWPDEIAIELQPPHTGEPTRVASLWHAPETRVDMKVALLSRDGRPRRIRLRFETDRAETARLALPAEGIANQEAAPEGWREEWTRWDWERRVVPEESGGAAVMAQDAVADDNSLVLLLLPGEMRVAEVVFDVDLNPGAHPGDYPLALVFSSVEDETVAEAAAENEGLHVPEVGERELDVAPLLLALRHPKPRWIGYLPGIYQAPLEPRVGEGWGYEETPFFGRFLKGFEDALEPTQTLAGHLDEFFGAMSAPPDFLPWLATWVGLVLDENWPQLKKRRLIREAAELYRWRGTRRGLERYLEIYTGFTPQIQDQPFSGMRLGAGAVLGKSAVIGHIAPHSFRVTLVVEGEETVREETVRAIIESHKPAHTAYELRIVPAEVGGREAEVGEEAADASTWAPEPGAFGADVSED